jgi:hypothetical protein
VAGEWDDGRWNDGMVEEWNVGILTGELFHSAMIPVFQYSNFPTFAVSDFVLLA